MTYDENQTGKKTLYIIKCRVTGESDEVVVCQECSKKMPLVGNNVSSELADDDIECEFCKQKDK